MNASYVLQIVAFVPLMYMCICTYYSLFKVGMLMFYSLTPRQTSSVSLLMICAMVARYAPPISYNFLNLICLDGNSKTTFELRMGNIDDAVPFFGKGFNKIYPLIMVVYTLLIASNFFGRLIDYLGSWKKFKIQNEEQDVDGLDPSGVIILQKERSWLEQGHTVGELVIPLARNFYNSNMDVESDGLPLDRDLVNKSASITKKNGKESQSKGMKEETNPYDIKREPVAKKYAALKDEQGSQRTGSKENGTKDSQSLLSEVDSQQQFSGTLIDPPVRGVDSTWASMKSGLQSFRANIAAKKFLPLRQVQESSLHVRESSSESLDEIFQRLKKRPNSERTDELDLDD